MKKKDIYVTKPFLPPLEDYIHYLEEIWRSKRLTNNGPFHQDLENQLADFLDVEHVSLFNNGTTALLCALHALEIAGEVITTPYSFVATSHALLWNNISPVFVDIEKDGFNLDPDRIQEAISPRTQAILPVHCYGYPCDNPHLSELAQKNNLKLIYDAAHAFGVEINGRSILRDGDLSVLSFHSTKCFHTFEGGAIISPSRELKKKIDYIKNFGFDNEVSVVELGINGKMSEMNAAMGLLNLKYYPEVLSRRNALYAIYAKEIESIEHVRYFPVAEGVTANHQYFPVLLEEDFILSRDQLYDVFRKHGIQVRRYFYPLISSMAMYRKFPSADPGNLPNAVDCSSKVLCLPIYDEMDVVDVERIVSILRSP
jgi:dTDP-4-amino-4,6-dideoxy-D-glucose transaminase